MNGKKTHATADPVMHVYRTDGGVLHLTRMCSEAGGAVRGVGGGPVTVTRSRFRDMTKCACLVGGFVQTGEQKRKKVRR